MDPEEPKLQTRIETLGQEDLVQEMWWDHHPFTRFMYL